MAAKVEHKLTVQKRTISGRKVKNLRREGILPANVYGKDIKSISIQLPLKDFLHIYSQVGETGLVTLKIDDKEVPTLIHNIQIDPVSDQPVHADFLQVNLKEKVTATVPLEFVGEAPAEKEGIGVVVHQLREVEVEALPTDLPESITVDISGLADVDQAIHVKDLSINRDKVEIKEDDPERIIVSVAPPAKEEELEAAAPSEVAEGEQTAPTEGGEAQQGQPSEGEKEEKKEE